MASETKKTTKEVAKKVTKKVVAKKTEKTSADKFAVILTGGKQYVVRVGDVLKIEKIDPSEIKSDKITFDQVLLLDDGKETKVGAPTISGSKVIAEVLHEDIKEKKVLVMRFKSKSNYKKKNGHRQRKTVVKISEIK